jgi:hypothetical protein
MICMKELWVGELLLLFHSFFFDNDMKQLLMFNALLGVVHPLLGGVRFLFNDTTP